MSSHESIALVIPTLDRARGERTGEVALVHAGCEARLIVVDGPMRGFTKTVNDGLRQTKPTEDVCILNDDVTWFPLGWLATLHRVLHSNTRYGIVGPSGQSASVAREGRLGDTGIQRVQQLSFWCVLLKRRMIDDLGLLDERFVHYCSDNAYCIRARKGTWDIVWVRGVWLAHQHHGSGLRGKWKQQDTRLFMRLKSRGEL